jgi:hypothetical protein
MAKDKPSPGGNLRWLRITGHQSSAQRHRALSMNDLAHPSSWISARGPFEDSRNGAKASCVGREMTARRAKPESPLDSESLTSRLHDQSRIRIVDGQRRIGMVQRSHYGDAGAAAGIVLERKDR